MAKVLAQLGTFLQHFGRRHPHPIGTLSCSLLGSVTLYVTNKRCLNALPAINFSLITTITHNSLTQAVPSDVDILPVQHIVEVTVMDTQEIQYKRYFITKVPHVVDLIRSNVSDVVYNCDLGYNAEPKLFTPQDRGGGKWVSILENWKIEITALKTAGKS